MKVITLCGSLKFKEEMLILAEKMALIKDRICKKIRKRNYVLYRFKVKGK